MSGVHSIAPGGQQGVTGYQQRSGPRTEPARRAQEPRPGATPVALTLHGLRKPHTVPWQRCKDAQGGDHPSPYASPEQTPTIPGRVLQTAVKLHKRLPRRRPGPSRNLGGLAQLAAAGLRTMRTRGGAATARSG